MAKPSDSLSREYGFFHANSKTLTKEGQYTFESEYSAGHVLLMKDVLAESIPYFATQGDLDTWMTANPDVLKKYEKFPMSEVKSSITGQPVTDKQSWYIEDGGKWIKPMILGSHAPDGITNKPSSVLDPILYKEDGTTIVPSTMGVWWTDPFQGLLRFGAGYEPNKAAAYGGVAIGVPKITCYVYTGKKLLDVLNEQVNHKDFVYEATAPLLTHTISHNLNSTNLIYSIFEKDENGKWNSVIANIIYENENIGIVQLSKEQIIKVVLRRID